MIDWLASLTWWQWLVGAFVLAALEALLPGAVMIWFAISAAVIGMLLVVVPLPWQWQWVLWAVLGVVAMAGYRHYKRGRPDFTEQPRLNQRGQQYVGQVFTLVEPIENGVGKVRVGDTVWKVAGPELNVGGTVRVTGVDGAVLVVERADH
jgi:membrane protein implicated in regulation of membrane protease activity